MEIANRANVDRTTTSASPSIGLREVRRGGGTQVGSFHI